jgi:group I intron endonuclease
MAHNNNNLSFVPVIIYNNAETEKSKILLENKGRTGIYLWTHIETNRIYIGSAVDLSNRLSKYFSPSELKKWDNYISRALIHHGYSAFSLSIIEYTNISNLTKEETRVLILSREQFYLDLIFSLDEPNTFNILKVAGSTLGFRHSVESRSLMSKPKSTETKAKISKALFGENNPMFGKFHSKESLVKFSGENHPLFGKLHSAGTITKISEALSGENNPRGMLGKNHSPETLAKISAAKGTMIYVYDSQGTLVNTFSSANKAAENFDCSHPTIVKYAKNNKLFQSKWYLSFSEDFFICSNKDPSDNG